MLSSWTYLEKVDTNSGGFALVYLKWQKGALFSFQFAWPGERMTGVRSPPQLETQFDRKTIADLTPSCYLP
jgi:hypothetical protein